MTQADALPAGAVRLAPTYSAELVNPAAVPHRLRCARCPWQATGVPASLPGLAWRHDLAHEGQDARRITRDYELDGKEDA
jgi:hypothetical protein